MRNNNNFFVGLRKNSFKCSCTPKVFFLQNVLTHWKSLFSSVLIAAISAHKSYLYKHVPTHLGKKQHSRILTAVIYVKNAVFSKVILNPLINIFFIIIAFWLYLFSFKIVLFATTLSNPQQKKTLKCILMCSCCSYSYAPRKTCLAMLVTSC